MTTRVGEFTLGVLVQANQGERDQLEIAGVPVGRMIPEHSIVREKEGSIIIVIATDAPLLPLQLKRVARRATMGLARTGSMGSHTSGDIFIAFSTANPGAFRDDTLNRLDMLPDNHLNPIFQAAVQSTEEAIINALVASGDMVGAGDRKVIGLPLKKLSELFP